MSDASSHSSLNSAPGAEAGEALPAGFRLSEFELRDVIGAGGFGIVYRAWDTALEREVAIKEYMPLALAGRGPESRVTLRSRSCEEDFSLGLRSFVNEARLLARFDHPALVKVHRFWEGNGTAYMVMPLYRGKTLRQLRTEMGAAAPDEAWIRRLIDPVLGALEVLHRADVFHRDIAPDNILWCDDGQAVLLDFGAARQVLADRTQSLTAILKPQFAPIEQYADTPSMRQGAWTDLYGLGSTCYYMLTGRAPMPATARVLDDELPPLARLAPAGCSPRLLETLDWTMAVRPQDRPRDVAALRDVLQGRAAMPERRLPAPAGSRAGSAPAATQVLGKTVLQEERAHAPVAVEPSADEALTSSGRPQSRPRRWRLALGAAVLLAGMAGLAGLAAWRAQLMRSSERSTTSTSPEMALPAAARAAQAGATVASVPSSAAPVASAPTTQRVAIAPTVLPEPSSAPSSAPSSKPVTTHISTPPTTPSTVPPHHERPHAVVARAEASPSPAPLVAPMRVQPAQASDAADVAAFDALPPSPASAASAAAHRRTLREVCTDDGAQNVGDCVKRLCENIPRFANYPACLKLRQQQGK